MRAWWGIAGVVVAMTTAEAGDETQSQDAAGEESDDVQDIAPEEHAPSEPAPPPPVPAKASGRAETIHTMDEVTIPTSYLRFGINFFGDTSFVVTTPDAPHTRFAIGTLGVRLLGQLSPSLDALAELAFESANGAPLADVEQLLIRLKSQRGVLELGRMHTDIGFWNRAYHHGLWLQTPIERPKAVRFEDDGGIVPVHWVGGHYTLHATDALAVTLGAGNGRGTIVDDILVNSETNEGKAALLKVRLKMTSVEVGVGAIYDVIAPADAMIRPALPDRRIHELIGNAYLAVRSDGPIVFGEAYVVRHQASPQSWMTYAAYGLAGYKVHERVTPYAAIDMILGANEDPFFQPDPAMGQPIDIVEGIAGTRIDVSTWSALKLELRIDHDPDSKDNAFVGVVNWSFGL